MKSIPLIVVTLGVVVVASVSGPASADPPPQDRQLSAAIELGARVGYSLPYGDAVSGNSMSSDINGRLPLELDAGLRLSGRNLFLGAYLAYAPVFLTSNVPSGISANTVDFGIQANYHMSPTGSIDPWFGLGVGWETYNMSGSANIVGYNINFSGNDNGFSFRAELGIDFLLLDNNLGIGPFVSGTLAQYTNCGSSGGGDCSISGQTLHGWFTFGARGFYDIGI